MGNSCGLGTIVLEGRSSRPWSAQMNVVEGRNFAPLPRGDEAEPAGTPRQNFVAMLIAMAALLAVAFLAGWVILVAVHRL